MSKWIQFDNAGSAGAPSKVRFTSFQLREGGDQKKTTSKRMIMFFHDAKVKKVERSFLVIVVSKIIWTAAKRSIWVDYAIDQGIVAS